MSSLPSTEVPLSQSILDSAPQNHHAQPSRVTILRNNIQSIFVGRGHTASVAVSEGSSNERANSAGSAGNSEGPKTPRFTINMPNLPSTRLIIPNLRRSTSVANRGSQSNTNLQVPSEASSNVLSPLPSPAMMPSRSIDSETLSQPEPTQLPEPSVTRENWRDRLTRGSRRDIEENAQPQAVGIGPEDQELAELATGGRRRRERRKRRPAQPGRSRSTSGTTVQYRSQRKRRAIKSKIISCVGSGLFLTLLLCIYLALALSKKIASQEFHVVIILIILVTTVFFCHSLIRLCVLFLQPAAEFDVNSRSSSAQGSRMNHNFSRAPGGYANPDRPIRVQILRDEEAAGIESDATKFPPPAYGLWRESVRVDPNRIFWARNTEEGAPELPPIPSQSSRQSDVSEERVEGSLERTTTANRPPSYMSEDGVDYIIEARGRSIAPPESGVTEMHAEHANQASRQVDRRGRGISLSHARDVIRRERQ